MKDDKIAWKDKDKIFLKEKESEELTELIAEYDVIPRLKSELYTCWDSTSTTPGYGVFHQLYNWYCSMKTPDIKLWPMDLMQDVQYWKFSRVCESFIVLIDRPDGTILVQENEALGESMNVKFVNGKWTQKPPYPAPMFHGPIAGMIASTT